MRIVFENNHIPEVGKYKDTFLVDDTADKVYIYDFCGTVSQIKASGGIGQVISVNGLIGEVILTNVEIGLGNVTNDLQLKASDKDTNGALASNSDAKIPSQKAVKTYVDTLIGTLDANVVHRTGNESIAGNKTFLGTQIFDDGNNNGQTVKIVRVKSGLLTTRGSIAGDGPRRLRGLWVSGRSYIVGDGAVDAGILYVCQSATSGVTAPGSDASNWKAATDDSVALQAVLDTMRTTSTDPVSGVQTEVIVEALSGQSIYINSTVGVRGDGIKLNFASKIVFGPTGRLRIIGELAESPNANLSPSSGAYPPGGSLTVGQYKEGSYYLVMDSATDMSQYAAGQLLTMRGQNDANGQAILKQQVTVQSVDVGGKIIYLEQALEDTYYATYTYVAPPTVPSSGQSNWTSDRTTVTINTSAKLTGSVSRGDYLIPVDHIEFFKPGDLVLLTDDVTDDSEWYDSNNFMNRELGVVTDVTSGTGAGNVTLSHSLMHAFSTTRKVYNQADFVATPMPAAITYSTNNPNTSYPTTNEGFTTTNTPRLTKIDPIRHSQIVNADIRWSHIGKYNQKVAPQALLIEYAIDCFIKDSVCRGSGTNNIAINTITWSGSVVTVTTAIDHKLAVGDTVNIQGTSNSAYQGQFVVASVADTTHFTYALTSNPGTSSANNGMVNTGSSWYQQGIRMQDCYACGVINCQTLDPYLTGSGKGYGFTVYGATLCYIADAFSRATRHSYLLFNGAAGSRLINCTSENALISDFDFHGGNTTDSTVIGCKTFGGLGVSTDRSQNKCGYRTGNYTHPFGDNNVVFTNCEATGYAAATPGADGASSIQGMAFEVVPPCTNITFRQCRSSGNQYGLRLYPSTNSVTSLKSGIKSQPYSKLVTSNVNLIDCQIADLPSTGSVIYSNGTVTGDITMPLSAASWSSSVVTITTPQPHGLTNGQSVVIAGMTPSAYNGTYTITSVADTTHFTYALVGDPGTATVFGTAKNVGGIVGTQVVQRVLIEGVKSIRNLNHFQIRNMKHVKVLRNVLIDPVGGTGSNYALNVDTVDDGAGGHGLLVADNDFSFAQRGMKLVGSGGAIIRHNSFNYLTDSSAKVLDMTTTASPGFVWENNSAYGFIPVYSASAPAALTDGTFLDKSKRRVSTLVVATSTYTPNVNTTDEAIISSPSANFTVAAPTGLLVDGQTFILRIKSGATGYTPTWNSIYQSSGIATLPSAALPNNKTITLGFKYDAAAAKMVLLAIDDTGY